MDENQKPIMQPTQGRAFPKFGELPKELRDMIWDRVIRDARPGAHFLFTTPGWSVSRSNKVQNECKLFGQQLRIFRFSAPSHYLAPTAAAPWITHNPSTYTIDSGLWTACHESLDAMQRWYYRSHNHLDPQNSLGHAVCSLAGRSGVCTTRNSQDREEKQYFTVLAQDLVCFQMPELAYVYLYTLDKAFVNQTLLSRGVEHVALEFDPSWDFLKPRDFRDDSVSDSSLASSLAGARSVLSGTIWFIDHRIRRTRDPSRSRVLARDGRHVFRGNGCRLVSVYPSDTEWEYEDGTRLTTEGHNVFSFVSQLSKADYAGLPAYELLPYDEDSLDDYLDDDDDGYEYLHPWELDEWFHSDDFSWTKLGVLACEVCAGPTAGA
ncbi:hypothetical protein F5Y05DRAFT_389487 [Hypoxylon sp. FL0543]|nr:hypothetical protein F5Y05DRAFT_389487 [Hypoxylon sp. FL0543]